MKGVTVCPSHRVQHGGPSVAGHETPDSFLFRESTAPRSPEQKLAAAKILQMLQDLGGKGWADKGNKRINHIRAERWFFGPSDFELWCETAGLDPETVRNKAKEIDTQGWPKWRAAAGTSERYHERKRYRERKEKRQA
jgi:hypothetical protein